MSLSQSSSPTTTAPIARRVAALRVVQFDPGTVLGLGDPGNKVVLYSNNVFNAAEFNAEFFEEVWLISGSVVIEYTHARGARLTPAPNAPNATSSTSTNDTDGVVAVGAAAVTVLAASSTRRQLTLQNVGLTTLYISKTPNPPASANAGDKILAVLAPGAVAGDGTGGTFTCSGYAGAVYAIGSGAGGLLAVGAY